MNKVSLIYKCVATAIFVVALIYCYFNIGLFNLVAWSLPPSEDPFNTPGIPAINFFNAIIYFFYYVFALAYIYFTSLATGIPQDPSTVKFYGDNFFVSYYYTLYFSLLLFSIANLAYFFIKTNQKNAINAFKGPILIIIIAAMNRFWLYIISPDFTYYVPDPSIITPLYIIFGFLAIICIIKGFTRTFKKKMRAYFYFIIAGYLSSLIFATPDIYNSLNDILGNFYNNSPFNTGLYFFSDPIFIGALLLYLFFEFLIQAAYIDKINLSATQEKKIEKQLKNLEERVKDYESKVKTKVELHTMSIRRQFSSEAFDFIREVAEQGVLEEEQKLDQIFTIRELNKLHNYLETLYSSNPEAEMSLKAKTAQPQVSNIVKGFTIGLVLKVGLIMLLLYLCFNPAILYFASIPISNSLEMQLIEVSVMVIAPLALIFPAIALIFDIRRKKQEFKEK